MTQRFLPRRLRSSFQSLASDGTEHLKNLLAFNAMYDYISWYDDFVGSDASTWPASANWMYPATVGTGTEVIGITAAEGGTLTATTGGSSGNGAYQYFGLNWKCAKGWYAAWYASAASVTSAKFEIGVTDSLTNEGIISTASATAPTFTATDAVAFCFDTSADANLYFITVAGGVLTNTSTAPDLAMGTFDTAYHWYEIVCVNGGVIGYMDGRQVGRGTITKTTAVGPQVAGATTRTGSAKTTTVDLALMIGPRFS